MTTAQQHIHQQLEAQRWTSAQAAREQGSEALKLNALERAGELALAGRLRESRRVLELNFLGQE